MYTKNNYKMEEVRIKINKYKDKNEKKINKLHCTENYFSEEDKIAKIDNESIKKSIDVPPTMKILFVV